MGVTLCEVCGEKKVCATTAYHGAYCAECIRMIMEQERDALREIRAEKKETKEQP